MANILDDNEKQEIYKILIDIFGTESASQFSLARFQNEIDSLIKRMDITEHQVHGFYNGKPISYIRYRMGKDIAKKNLLAAEGYSLIFKFREYLLGEHLTYRYYFIDDDNQVNIRNFTELELLDFMTFEEQRIGLNSHALIQSEDLKDRSTFQKMVNEYIQRYTSPDSNDYMRTIGYLNLRKVRKNIKLKYGYNKGLSKGKDGRQYQTFNMGHIFESVDLSLTYQLLHPEKNYNIDDLMFGIFLKRDTVIASKGGDNFLTNTSIKSGSASIYSYNTIANQLKQISFMLASKDPAFIKNKIEKLYLDNSEKSVLLERDLETAAQNATNKLLEEIEKSLNKN